MSDPLTASSSLPHELHINKYPRIIIQFCTKCKWTNRAIWYAQELFQTFDANTIADISLQPIVEIPGTFQVLIQVGSVTELIYRRKFKKDGDDLDLKLAKVSYEGFPDAKFLKNLVRDKISEIESTLSGGGNGGIGTKVGDHLIGKGSLLNDGGVGDEAEARECLECKRQE
ncbi:hypothetical protein CANMA_003457 [Candida margitis]|uniref:uncharacterized protein n=1 Tax=Candida margitis TaxID=1775924 RepID=UPI0022269E17|nr:uncharacterized protein CANMA_003457 [Candida margitis]KAI5964947.1 hypothetical protein CANMA_003457 [Candida margitis]